MSKKLVIVLEQPERVFAAFAARFSGPMVAGPGMPSSGAAPEGETPEQLTTRRLAEYVVEVTEQHEYQQDVQAVPRSRGDLIVTAG
jgi:hypothetical protein